MSVIRDELTTIPNIKDSSKSKVHYKIGVDIARDNYCDTLMEYLSDMNFINRPTFEKRKEFLNKKLYELEEVCRMRFMKEYREY